MKVRNMTNNNGNKVPNQFIITTNDAVYFQSYQSIIVKNDNGQITLGRDWDYSVTTGKYRNIFLGENKAETQKKLDSGKYLYDENL